VKVLIQVGNAQYTKSNNGTTPLHIAVNQGELGIVRYFVEELHADVNAIKELEDGEQVANEGGQIELKVEGSEMTPLKLAVVKGFNEIAQYLISKGAKISKA
jgi:ankyrin repeat protein